MTTVLLGIQLTVHTCIRCGMTFAVPTTMDHRYHQSHETFYCPAGHGQSYTGESDADKLKKLQRQLEAAKKHAKEMEGWGEEQSELRRQTERRLSATKGQLTKTKKRIAGGVCPCCNRTFQDLGRHMAGEHPDYATTEGSEKPA